MEIKSIDSVIQHLLSCRTSTNMFNLTQQDIKNLCAKSKEIFMAQPALLEIDIPVVVCGDIHGYFYELLRVFDRGGFPPCSNYLFLGDYVDRGKMCLETMCLLLAYKVKYPEKFYLLRGNHECSTTSFTYGFFDECVERCNSSIWDAFMKCFNCMPVAAIVQQRYFCCHGGLSPRLNSMEQIRNIQRPVEVRENALVADLLWSDPERNMKGWNTNSRGIGYTFGADVIEKFLEKQGFEFICRGHEVVKAGFEVFENSHLITIFSARGYGKHHNDGAIMSIDKWSNFTFEIIPFKQE